MSLPGRSFRFAAAALCLSAAAVLLVPAGRAAEGAGGADGGAGEAGGNVRLLVVGPLRDCEASPRYESLLACDNENARVFENARVEPIDAEEGGLGPKGWMPHPDDEKAGWYLNPEGLGVYGRFVERGQEEDAREGRWPARIFAPVVPELGALRATLYFKGLKRLVARQSGKEIETPDARTLRALRRINERLLQVPNKPDDAKDIAGMFGYLNADLALDELLQSAKPPKVLQQPEPEPYPLPRRRKPAEAAEQPVSTSTASQAPLVAPASAQVQAPEPRPEPAKPAPPPRQAAAARPDSAWPRLLQRAGALLGKSRKPFGYAFLVLGATLLGRETVMAGRVWLWRRRRPGLDPEPDVEPDRETEPGPEPGPERVAAQSGPEDPREGR